MRLILACSTILDVWKHRGTFRQSAVIKYDLRASESRYTSGTTTDESQG